MIKQGFLFFFVFLRGYWLLLSARVASRGGDKKDGNGGYEKAVTMGRGVNMVSGRRNLLELESV